MVANQTHDGEEARGTDAARPRLSVILPVYNGERYLQQAIDSILAQTEPDFELIAVDDASSDRSLKILAENRDRDSRIRINALERNGGLPAALNAGFALARGDWLSWTSDDNILLPETYASLFAHADANPEADIAYADYRIIDEAGARGSLVEVGSADQLAFRNAVGCCFIYRRSVDEALGGYDEALFGVEDYDFWLRAAQAGFRFEPLSRELYLYRRHDRSLTDLRAREIHGLTNTIMQRHLESLPRSPGRASAWLNLAMRDPMRMRADHLWRALREKPALLPRAVLASIRWLRTRLSFALS